MNLPGTTHTTVVPGKLQARVLEWRYCEALYSAFERVDFVGFPDARGGVNIVLQKFH